MNRLFAKFLIILFCAILFTSCLISLEQRRKWVISIPFDEEKWKINDAEMRSKFRPGMARDLINRKTLTSKSCEEIDDLLNIYEHIDCNKNTVDFELKQFYGAWLVGFDPISTEVLKIYFDNNQKVEKAEIVFYEPGEKRE